MNISKASELLSLLSDQSRLTIIKALQKNNKMYGADLLNLLNCGQPTLSHHMNCMKEAKLIKATKKGNKVFYSINKDTYSSLLNFLNKRSNNREELEDFVNNEIERSDKEERQENDVPVYLL